MGFSPLADMKRRIPDVGRSSERLGKVQGVLIHHNAGVNAYGQATAAGREVSAHYWITNEGDLLPNIDETRRAWTSGHPAYPAGALADHRFITVEVSNSRTGGNWPISAKAEDMLARLIGDVHRRYNLGQVKRGTQSGVAVHRDFVATECPGGYVMANLDRIIRKAEQYRTTGAAGGATGGLTVSEYKKLEALIKKENKKVYDHITYQFNVTRGPSWLGWVKSKLWTLVHRDPTVNVDIDAAELATEIREAFGDDLASDVADELGKRLGKK